MSPIPARPITPTLGRTGDSIIGRDVLRITHNRLGLSTLLRLRIMRHLLSDGSDRFTPPLPAKSMTMRLITLRLRLGLYDRCLVPPAMLGRHLT